MYRVRLEESLCNRVGQAEQIDEEKPLTVTNIYDMSENGNGKSYVVDNMPPITSRKSTYSILSAHNECSKFLELLNGSNLMVRSLSSINGTCVDKNISVFDAFNYTVYVPTNASIQKLIDNGYLPTWTDYENLTAADFGGDNARYRAAKTKLEAIITDFPLQEQLRCTLEPKGISEADIRFLPDGSCALCSSCGYRQDF